MKERKKKKICLGEDHVHFIEFKTFEEKKRKKSSLDLVD